MADQSPKSDDARQHDRQNKVAEPAPQPFLRMKPGSFFSNRFDLEIVADYSKDEAEGQRISDTGWLSRLMDLNLLFLIVFVGVPVLVYCIFASAG